MVMFGMMIYTMHRYWPLNFTLCIVWQVFDFAMCSVSILHLCLIAFDRLVQDVKAFQGSKQYKIKCFTNKIASYTYLENFP